MNALCKNLGLSSAAVFGAEHIATVGTREHSFCLEARFGCKSNAFSSLVFTEELTIATGRSVSAHLRKHTGAGHSF